MSNESGDKAMATYIANIEKTTGKNLDHWVAVVKKSKLEKHSELVNMLKTDHGITYGYANMIVHTAKGGFEAAQDGDNLVATQYKGKENLKAWYDKLLKEIQKFGKDIEVAPKKTYVSLRRKKQFAIIQPSSKDRLDVGLNIKKTPPSGIALASGSWNAMCTHRIKVEDEKLLGKELLNWIKLAYDEAG